jgi:Flp pilus assembly protein TadG
MPVTRVRRGNTSVEFALIVPVLLLLTFGIMDWVWYLVDYQAVMVATQAGVRTGSQTMLVDDPVAAAEEAAEVNLTASYPSGTPTGSTYEGVLVDGDTVSLTVSVPFEPLVGFVFTPDTVSSTSQMRIEDAS